MRYPQGGGLTAERQQFREELRLRAANMAYTIQGVRKLLARNGWSWQIPARRAMERDDGVVAGWVKEVWPCAEDSRRPVEPGSSSRTKPDSP
ncbi:hypothetical protein GSF24_17115 [Microbispora triticiradicis]|nr:hypothetical protein [Microbispora triticiradicis]